MTRLVAPVDDEEKIAVHQFMAAVSEFQRGAPGVTPATIATTFELSAGELSALSAWYTSEWVTGNVTREIVHDALLLGEAGHYTLAQVKARLNL